MEHTSIFAKFNKALEIETASKSKRVKRTDQDYELSQQESRNKLLNEAQGLIPYSGSVAISSVANNRTDILYPEPGVSFYGGSDSFLGTVDTISKIITDKWTKGIRSDGAVFYTTPFGLVFEIRSPIPDGVLQQIGDWTLADVQWLHYSLTNQEYFKFQHPCIRRLNDFLPYVIEAKEKQRQEDHEKYRREVNTKCAAILCKIGETVDPISIELMEFILGYDYIWEYSDDHSFSLRYMVKLRIVDSHLQKYPLLKRYFDDAKVEFFKKVEYFKKP